MKPYPLAALLFLMLFIGYPLRAVTYPDTLSGTFQHNGETVGYWLPDTYDGTEPTRILVFMRGAGGGLSRPDAFISALETRGVTAILLSNQDSYGTILPDVLVSDLAAEGLNVKDKIFLTGFSRGGQMTRRIAMQLADRGGLLGAAPQNYGASTTPGGRATITLRQHNGNWLTEEPGFIDSNATPWTGTATEVGLSTPAVPESEAVPFLNVCNLGERTRLTNQLLHLHAMHHRTGYDYTHLDTFWGPQNEGHKQIVDNHLAVVDYYLSLENHAAGNTAPAASIDGAHTRIINPGVETTVTGLATDAEDDDATLALAWYQTSKYDADSLKQNDFLSYSERYLNDKAGWFPLHENGSISQSLGANELFDADNRPAALSSTDSFTFTPPTVARDTPVFLEFKATDADGFADTDSLLVIINGPPRILEGPQVERSVAKNASTPMRFRALDADSDGLSWSVAQAPQNGTLGWQDAAGENAQLTYTPTTGYTGADSFTIEVTDAGGLSETLTAQLTVSDTQLSQPATMDAILNNGGDVHPFVSEGATMELKTNDDEIGNWNDLNEIYFRFPLDGFAGQLVSAKLRVYVTQRNQTNEPDTFDLYEVGDFAGDELASVWSADPVRSGGNLGSISVDATGYYEIDITTQVQASLDSSDNLMTLQLARTGSKKGPHLDSRHSATPAQRPQLIMETLIGDPQAPLITSQPADLTVDEGAEAVFSVVAEGNPLPDYQWRKDGVALSDGSGISGATTDQLTLSAATPADNGSYTVVVSNSEGSVTSNPANLTVNPVPPTIGTDPVGGTMVEGDSLVLSVSATGSPPLSYEWRKDGTPLSDGGNLSGTTTDTLSLDPLTLGDSGSYTVVVTNNEGSATSAAAEVTVYEAPELLVYVDFNDQDTDPTGNWNVLADTSTVSGLTDYSTGLATGVGLSFSGDVKVSGSSDQWGFRSEDPDWADPDALDDRFYVLEGDSGSMTITGLDPGVSYDLELAAAYAGPGRSGEDPGHYVLNDANGTVEGFNALTETSLGTEVDWITRYANEAGDTFFGEEGWLEWKEAVATASGTLVFDLSAPTGSFPRIALNALRIAPSPSAPTGIEAWRLTHFGTTDNAGEAADTASPAEDGIPNLLKYAFGLDPNENSSGLYAGPGEDGLPSLHKDGNALVLTYRKDTAKDDISYTVQTSTDLQAWQTAGISETVIATEGSVEVREASVPIEAASSPRFLKVEVTRS